MPYKSPDEVAKKVPGADRLSEKKRRQFMHVWNSVSEKGGSESSAFAQAWSAVKVAYSVVNKAQKTAHMQERIGRMTERVAARRMEAGFLDDVRAVKMKARALEFFQAVKDFRGATNSFLKEMTSAVKDPRALQGFPEIRDVIELGEFMKKGVLRHTFLSEADLSQKMQKVVELDA
jgi:cation transport regulator ChaB